MLYQKSARRTLGEVFSVWQLALAERLKHKSLNKRAITAFETKTLRAAMQKWKQYTLLRLQKRDAKQQNVQVQAYRMTEVCWFKWRNLFLTRLVKRQNLEKALLHWHRRYIWLILFLVFYFFNCSQLFSSVCSQILSRHGSVLCSSKNCNKQLCRRYSNLGKLN